MASLPRFLPLIAVAIGGVLALKLVTSLSSAPELLKFAAANAEAGQAARPAKSKKAAASTSSASSSTSSADATSAASASSSSMAEKAMSILGESSPAVAEVKPAPVCATSVSELAREANMPESEVTILQSLKDRRQQLDSREAQLNAQSQLVDAASAKLDGRIRQLGDLKTQIEALLAKANKTADDDNQRLVAVYSAMKPKDAAAALAKMSDEVRLPIAAAMKPAKLAAILGAMPSAAEATELTEKLAQRMKRANDIQDRLNQVTSNPAPAAQASASSDSAGASAKARPPRPAKSAPDKAAKAK